MDNKILDRVIIFSGIGILFFLSYLALKPILFLTFLAFILAYALRPLFLRLNRYLKMKGLSALIIIIGLTALVVLPVVFLTPALIKQSFNLYDTIKDINIVNILTPLIPSGLSSDVIEIFSRQFSNMASSLLSSTISSLSSLITDIPMKVLKLLIFLAMFYFILVDFEYLKKYLDDVLPISANTRKKFTGEFRNVTDGVLYGQILIGVLQGVLLGLVMFMLGIEGTLVFTVVGIIAGVLPMIGPTFVWIPLGIVLLLGGFYLKALVLALGGMAITAITDYVLKPYILSKRTQLSAGLGFLSMIGGFLSFGLVGLVLGPLLVSYLLIIIQFYKDRRFEELFKK